MPKLWKAFQRNHSDRKEQLEKSEPHTQKAEIPNSKRTNRSIMKPSQTLEDRNAVHNTDDSSPQKFCAEYPELGIGGCSSKTSMSTASVASGRSTRRNRGLVRTNKEEKFSKHKLKMPFFKDKKNNRSAAELGVETRKRYEEITPCKTKESKAGGGNSSHMEGSFQSQQQLKTNLQNDSSQAVSLANDDNLSAKSLLLPDAGHQSTSDDIGCECSHCPCGKTVIRHDNMIQKHKEKQPADEYESTFKLIIHQNEDFKMRLGKLDTGATVNVVSNAVVSALNMQTELYDGPPIDPLGEPFTPERKIKIDWHVDKFPKTYTTEFLVIPNEISKDFDILLSDSTIKEIGFFKRNDKVFWLDSTI